MSTPSAFYNFIAKHTDIFLFKNERCRNFSHFFNKKILAYFRYYIWNLNEKLTNDVVSFEQVGQIYTLLRIYNYFPQTYIVNSRYLKVEVHPKLLISPNKFSSTRKFTLRYQQFEITGVEMQIKISDCVQTIKFDIRLTFETSVFGISRADYLAIYIYIHLYKIKF